MKAACSLIRDTLLGEPAGQAALRSGLTLPSFFVIGPPRTGTTWLHNVLRARTLLPRWTKETRFFDTYFHRGIRWYAAHYAQAKGKLVGEIAPTYFASHEASERIAQTIPFAKVVCIFRNPVERLVSLYRTKRAYGMVPWNLAEAITRDRELVESGKYATNLKRWQQSLGTQQVLATIYDDLRDDPQGYVDALTDFIGLPRFLLTASEIHRVHASESLTHPRSYYRTWAASALAERLKARRLDFVVAGVRSSPLLKLFLGGGPAFAQLSFDETVKLYELFRPEVEMLESLLNRDLSGWKPAVARSKATAAASEDLPSQTLAVPSNSK
jgi:hypothetical protein